MPHVPMPSAREITTIVSTTLPWLSAHQIGKADTNWK